MMKTNPSLPWLRPWLKVLLLLAVLLGGRLAQAQSLTRLEYYYDTDPGHGLATQVVFPGGASATRDYTFTASLSGLTPGFHTLYTRVLEQRAAEVNPMGPLGPLGAAAVAGQPNNLPARKAWSIANVRPVYVGPVGTGLDNLTRLEYYFDTDPGYGAGQGVALSPVGTNISQNYVADLSGLTPGFHTMYTRVKNAAGAWSIANVRAIYVGPTSGAGGAPSNLTYAEYYIDTDPGYRQGTRVNFATPGTSIDQNFVADLSGVPNGFHTLFVRVRNAAGAWSLTNVRPFVRSGITPTAAAPNLTRCEYYLDTDPGHGLGTNVPLSAGTSIDQSFVADLTGVSNGVHTLYVRVRDASRAWSIVQVRPFVRQGSIAGAARPLITQFRYQVFPSGSATASSPPEYYVLPVAARAADVDVTFPTNVCVTAAGNYILRVTALDANGVPAIEYKHPFAVTTPSQFNPNLPANLAGCSGQSLTITSATAGAGGTYQWSRNGTALMGEVNQNLTVTTAATYAVTVTSGAGCTGAGSTNVTFSPAPTIALAPFTDVPCGQASTVLDAGAGYASYAWTPGGATTQTITATAPGTYSVTVTGASTGSCTATGSTVVRMPKANILQASATQCAGTSTTFTLATPVNGTIVWQANGTVISGQTGTSLTVAPTATTTYTAVVSDGAFSCSAARTTTIPPALPLNLPPTTVVACTQTSATLDAGSGGTSYQWNLGGTNISGANSQTYTANAPGLYGVTVSNGCAVSDQTNVIMPHSDIQQASQAVCTGGSLTLTLATPVHGTIGWQANGTTISGQSGTSLTVSPTATTTYSAVVSDQGQSCTDAVTISVGSPPVVSLPADSSPACGTASVTLNPGAGAGSYAWNTGAVTPTITVTTPGTYSVTASNGSCSATASTTVFMPYASIVGGSPQRVCTGQSITLSLATPVNGTPVWNTGATTNSITVSPTANTTYAVTVSAGGRSCAATVNVVVDPLPAVTLAAQAPACLNASAYALGGGLPTGGTYSGPGVSGGSFDPASAGAGTHTITYSFTNGNSCTATATRPLTVNPLPTVTLAAQPSRCFGAAAAALTGGAPAGGTYSGPGVSGGSFSAASAGPGTFPITYTYTDGNGCPNAATRPLTVLPLPTLAVTPDTVLCPGSQATLAVSNAGPGATYAWNTGAASSSSTAPAPAAVGSPVTYSVTVTNAAGCPYVFTRKIYRSPASVAPLAVSAMQPVDNSAGLDLPVNFGWNPGSGSNASSFDLYVWPSSGSQPGTPTVAGITSLQYSYGGAPLAYGQSFSWRVVARNACGNTAGPVQTFQVRQLPDLTVPFVQAADTAYAGQTVAASWNVRNTGVASTLATQWQDAVYFSQNPTFDGTAIYMGAVGNVTYLQPNGTYISQGTFNVPLNMAGYYYVYVKANNGGSLLETNYANNTGREATGPLPALGRCLVIVPTTPDLVVQTISNFSTYIGGDTAAVGYRVRNTGSVAVPLNTSWTDAVYFSPDTTQNISQNTGSGILGPTARRGFTGGHSGLLGTNAFYNASLRMPIPHTTLTGDYYLYAFTDDNNDVFETASTNNVNPRTLVNHPANPAAMPPTAAYSKLEFVPVRVTLRPPPDLIVRSVTAPAAATAGTTLNASWVVKNAGLLRPYPRLETYWADNVYISLNPTLDGTEISLGQVFHYEGVNGLQPNATYAASGTLPLPNGISGNYYVFVKTDAGNNVFEYLNENNNVARSAGTVAINLVFADLNPTTLTVPASVSAHNAFVVNYTIRNTTTAVIAAGGTWTDNISVNDGAGHAATLASVTRTGPLAIGASYSGTATLHLPINFVPGTLTVTVAADAANSVYEFNYEGNNTRTTTLTYVYSDDLAVQNLTATPSPAASAGNLTVGWRVRNLGTFKTLASSWTDEVYLSVDNVIDGSDLLLANAGSLGGQMLPNAFYTQSQTVALPQGISGPYFVLVRTTNNPNGTLADTNPANNTAALALPVTLTPPADLRVVTAGGTAPTVSTATPLAGQQVTITYRVQNFGTGPTPAASWNDGIYLNTSPTVAGATRIGVVSRTGALAAGGFYNVSTTVTIPGYLGGNYYLFIATDSNDPGGYGPRLAYWGGAVQVGQVYEHQQEFNNTWQAPTTIAVAVPLPSDLVVTLVAVPGTARLGKQLTVSYSVRNQGSNPAVGLLKDGLYLSSNRVLNTATDKLFGTNTRNLTIAANQTITGTIRDRVQGLNPGSYHGILGTNLYNDIFESDYQNDTLSQQAPTVVSANVLPLNTLVPFALDRDSLEFYQVTPGAGFDLRIALGSNQNGGQNEVYVAHNRVPTTSDFDYIYESPLNTRQELLIPSTLAGPYYILVKTPYVYAGLQTVTLFAEALPFQVRSIDSDTVGQGRVTTRVLGAGFVRRTGSTAPLAGTRFYLTKGSNAAPLAYASIVRFRSSVEVSLRWFLDRDSVKVGQYNVVAEQANGTKVQLTNGLTVQPNSGQLVNFATITPPTLRVQTRGNWTYFLTNSSNVDIPYWEFQFAVPPGAGVIATHTPNVRKKSQFAPAVALSNSPDNGFAYSASGKNTEVFPFIGQDLRPGEIMQVNLNMLPPISYDDLANGPGTVHFPVVLNQQPASEQAYSRRTLDFVARYKAAVLANPAAFAPAVAALASNPSPTIWRDSLQARYLRLGLLDAAWTVPATNPKAPKYTHKNSQTAVPGGVANDWWQIEEQYHEFRPDPFTAGFPLALRPAADSVRFLFNARGASSTAIITSLDPNRIAGSDGYGPRRMVGTQQRLPYQVQFENDRRQATGPAQRVRVRVPLDITTNLQTFRLGDFGFNNTTYPVPPNASTYSQVLSLPALAYNVRVVAGIDVSTRQAFWDFQSIDKQTGLPPTDPLLGFLPISDTLGNGHGFVNYTISPGGLALTGDSLIAQASIVFDNNSVLKTNRWGNLVDAAAPISQINVLPASQLSRTVNLAWTGSDDTNGSGLRSYELFVAQDSGPFIRVAQDIGSTSYAFVGQPGARYDFFTLATDHTDNREKLKLIGDTFTVIEDTALVVYNLVQNQCLTSDPVQSTGSGLWQRLKLNGQTVAAFNDQGRVLGTVRVEFSVMTGPTRQDARGTKYLDRNWHFIAQNPLGTGNAAQVRFYGLTTEFNKLQAADPANVSGLNSLRLTQYSGPNEDCSLANNVAAGSSTRLLTPALTSRADLPYFVAQATITDHFSEFYLNGGNRPLPVELTSFGATRQGRNVLTAWTTASERNSAVFVVEASALAREGFAEVGRVAAAGTSTGPRRYALTDRDVPATGGLRYYRLRQVDADGLTSFSRVQVVQLDRARPALVLQAAPNPFRQAELLAHVEVAEAATGTLQLTDLAGRTLLARTLPLAAGSSTVPLPELAPLPPGVYVLTLRVGGEVRQQKVTKE